MFLACFPHIEHHYGKHFEVCLVMVPVFFGPSGFRFMSATFNAIFVVSQVMRSSTSHMCLKNQSYMIPK